MNPFAQRKRDNKNDPPRERQSGPYKEIVRENATFEAYYKHMKVCPEAEWDDFLAAMRRDLPVCFRVTSSKGESERLIEIVKDKLFVDYVKASEELGSTAILTKPTSLPWYPNQHAFQLELTRKDIRRNERLFKLHNFLISVSFIRILKVGHSLIFVYSRKQVVEILAVKKPFL